MYNSLKKSSAHCIVDSLPQTKPSKVLFHPHFPHCVHLHLPQPSQCCLCLCDMYMLFFCLILSPLFIQLPSTLKAVSLFHVSMPQTETNFKEGNYNWGNYNWGKKIVTMVDQKYCQIIKVLVYNSKELQLYLIGNRELSKNFD